MAKDIERIIDELTVPEMEYVKPRTHKSISIDEEVEVPEIVLPKTKAEMYEEAKGRLEQKTAAVSKAYEADRKKKNGKKPERKPERKVKTVELETAAAAVAGTRSIEEKENIERIKARLTSLRKIVEEPKWVGSAEELVPFVWRMPLLPNIDKPTKVYRAAVRATSDRTSFLPAPRG